MVSLSLWAVFVFVQTIRHRDYFLPEESAEDESVHAGPPTLGETWLSFALLLVSLVAVVGLAKVLSHQRQLGLDAKDLVLLVLAFVVSSITLGTGRTYVMQGAVPS